MDNGQLHGWLQVGIVGGRTKLASQTGCLNMVGVKREC